MENSVENTIENYTEENMKLGNLYQFKDGKKGYFLAIDFDFKNNPIYVFGMEGFSYGIGKNLFSVHLKDLNTILKDLNKKIEANSAKIIFADYLKTSYYCDSHLKDIKEEKFIIKNGIIQDKEFLSSLIENSLSNIFIDNKYYRILLDFLIQNKFEAGVIVKNLKIKNNKLYFGAFKRKSFNLVSNESENNDYVACIESNVEFKKDLKVYFINTENIRKTNKNIKIYSKIF